MLRALFAPGDRSTLFRRSPMVPSDMNFECRPAVHIRLEYAVCAVSRLCSQSVSGCHSDHGLRSRHASPTRTSIRRFRAASPTRQTSGVTHYLAHFIFDCRLLSFPHLAESAAFKEDWSLYGWSSYPKVRRFAMEAKCGSSCSLSMEMACDPQANRVH